MITPQLEEFLNSGKAIFRTHTHGFSGVGVILVKQGSYIVITDFSLENFINTQVINEITDFYGKCIVQVKFFTKKQNWHYIFKMDFRQNEVVDKNWEYTATGNREKNCYMIADEDVFILINILPAFQESSTPEYEINAPVDQTELPDYIGWGTENRGNNDCIRWQSIPNFGDFVIWNWQTNKYNITGIGAMEREYNQFEIPCSNGTIFSFITYESASDTIAIPIINVSYVEVKNKKYNPVLWGGAN